MKYFLICLTMLYAVGVSATELEEAQSDGYGAITNSQISTHNPLVEESKIHEINFDAASVNVDSQSTLTELMGQKSANFDFGSNQKRMARVRVVPPVSQGLTRINGELCHVGDYPNCSLITVLRGPHRGMQTTVDYNGVVLCVNHIFFVEHTPSGVVLRHEYPGVTVRTGLDQVVIVR